MCVSLIVTTVITTQHYYCSYHCRGAPQQDAYVRVFDCLNVCVCVRARARAHARVFMCVCAYVCICICVSSCGYVFKYIVV